MNKYTYFQKTIHDRLITIGFHFKKTDSSSSFLFIDNELLVSNESLVRNDGYKFLVTAIAIQHPTLDKADEEKGKIIVKSRIDRAKHTDNKWAVISHISHYNRMLFTYPVLAAMAEAKFNHFETFPNDYIAGFDK